MCVWTLEALKEEHDVSLVTLFDVDFHALNTYYGTRLAASEIAVVVPTWVSLAKTVATSNLTFTFRQYLLSLFFKRIAHNYSICFSTFNEMDLGNRGIQYVHFPMFSTMSPSARELVNYPNSAIRRILRRVTAAVLGFSEINARRNLTLANSRWTADVIERLWGVKPLVIYPPVPSLYQHTPWNDRQDNLICISRIVPEKQLERAIMIVDGIRRRGFDVHLRIIGGVRSGSDRAYYDHIQRLQNERQNWLFLEHDLSRETLSRLLTSYKYGLHVRENEQFGIGVAEMLLAGCIPFVPDRGGQAEIVGGNSLLTFATENEAVEKIVAVLHNQRLQEELLSSLERIRPLFSEFRFMDHIRHAVAEFAKETAA